MTTPARPFSSQDDAIICEYWGKQPSQFIANILQRNAGAVRYRAQKLRLSKISVNAWKGRPSNSNAAKIKVTLPKLQSPSLPQLKFLATAPAMTQQQIRMRAQDFLHWRREVHGI